MVDKVKKVALEDMVDFAVDGDVDDHFSVCRVG